jgi:type IV secretory pathway VirB10-like protein
VSRGLADFTYKKDADKGPGDQKISCVPEMYYSTLDAGDFLILACDGIWDVMTTEEVCDAVLSAAESKDFELGKVCTELLRTCLKKDSKDNMTAMIVQLGAVEAPEPVPDEILGLEKQPAEDAAVKKALAEFLEYCKEAGPLPADAQKILDAAAAEKPKTAEAKPQTTQERMQKKLAERKQNAEKQAAAEASDPSLLLGAKSLVPKAAEEDLDALAALIEGNSGSKKSSDSSPKKKAKKKGKK